MGSIIAGVLMFFGMAEDRAVKIGQLITLGTIMLLLYKLFSFIVSAFRTPLFLAAVVAALTLFPDTCGWIFTKIGELELRVMALVMTALMPDIFGAGSAQYTSWSQIWSAGLSVLPSDMLQIINGLGVAQILGLVTATFTAVSTIKIYRKAMLRAGLL